MSPTEQHLLNLILSAVQGLQDIGTWTSDPRARRQAKQLAAYLRHAVAQPKKPA